MESKVCSRCGQRKPIDEFGKLSASPDGRAYYCRACVKEANRAAYLAQRERRKAYQKAYYATHREQASRQKKEHYRRNKAEVSQRQADYYLRNKDRIRAHVKTWRSARPEYVRTYNRRYATENAESISAYGRKYREEHGEKIRAYHRSYRQADPERARRNDTISKLAKYGVTLEEFRKMLAGQGGRCVICGAIPDGKRFAVDHQHVPGYAAMTRPEKKRHNRGLLCDRCNKMLGMFRDSPDVLRAAAAYLRNRARPKELP